MKPEESKAWKDECLHHREKLAKLAEALGWENVRQPNGDLHLPCIEDMLDSYNGKLSERPRDILKRGK